MVRGRNPCICFDWLRDCLPDFVTEVPISVAPCLKWGLVEVPTIRSCDWLVRRLFSCKERKHHSNLKRQRGTMLTDVIEKPTEKFSFRHGSIQEPKTMPSGLSSPSFLAFLSLLGLFSVLFSFLFCIWTPPGSGEDSCRLPQIYFPQNSQFQQKMLFLWLALPGLHIYMGSYYCVQENGVL